MERPPLLWELDADDESLIRLLGEMISAALVRNGGDLSHVVLNVSNVTVPPEAAGGPMPLGDFVAITIGSRGDWRPELARRPVAGGHPPLVGADLEAAALRAGVVYGYTRVLDRDEGSVTVFFARGF